MVTAEQIQAGKALAEQASIAMYDRMGRKDQYACGFAWVNIHGIKGNTKLGRAMKEAGVRQDYTKAFQLWNPSGLPVQNIDCKEAGAEACAKVLQKYGFQAYAGSRLD